MSFGDRWRCASVVATGSPGRRALPRAKVGSRADLRAEPARPSAGPGIVIRPCRADVRRFGRVRAVVCSADDDSDQRPGRRPAALPATSGRSTRPRRPADGESDVTRILQRAVDEAVLLLGRRRPHRPPRRRGPAPLRLRVGLTESRVQRWRSTLEAGRGERGGLIARAIATREVQPTDDYPATAASSTPPGRPPGREVGIRSLVAAPLIVGDRSVGALAIHADRPPRSRAGHRPRPGPGRPCRAAIGTADLIERLADVRGGLARRVEIQRSLSTVGAALASLHDPARRPPLHGRRRRPPARRRRRPARPRRPGHRQDPLGPRRRADRRDAAGSCCARSSSRPGEGMFGRADRDRRGPRHRRLPRRRRASSTPRARTSSSGGWASAR